MRSLRFELSVLLVFLFGVSSAVAAEPTMQAHSIDVGQGAATLLESPCGFALIDTGAQDEQHVDHLVDYLRRFFVRRTDLRNTIDVVIITHPHKDHTWGLENVARSFNIRGFVDNGVFTQGSGKRNVKWIRDEVAAGRLHTTIRPVNDSEITVLPRKTGLTDTVIDPIRCEHCDPQIRILSGKQDDNPGWSRDDYENWNNHSVVVRVDFGESSFLYTGDLEVPAIATIGVGHWTFGEGDPNFGINTNSFGHPRKVVLDMLKDSIPGRRSQPAQVEAGIGVHQFVPYTVAKRIYATAWDGDFQVTAGLDGRMRVDRVGRATPFAVADAFSVGPAAGAAAPREGPVALSVEQELAAEIEQAEKTARTGIAMEAPAPRAAFVERDVARHQAAPEQRHEVFYRSCRRWFRR